MDAVTMPSGRPNVTTTVTCAKLEGFLGATRKPMAQRAACDRCRGQKLRCPRMKPGSRTICDRCQRIGAVCRTAPRLPSGRPSLRSRDTPQRRSHPKDSSPNLLASEILNSLDQKHTDLALSHSSPSPRNTLSTEVSSWQSGMYDDRAPAGMTSDDGSIFGDYQSLPFGFDDMITAPDDRIAGFNFDFVEPSTPRIATPGTDVCDYLLIPSPTETCTSTASSRGSADMQLLVDQDIASPMGMMQKLHSGHRDFINCVSSISGRATSLLKFQWSTWDPQITECAILRECSHDPQTSGMDTSSDRRRLATAFEVMTDFVRLWCVTCQRFPSIAGSTKSALSLSEVLMLLATCIQIAQLLGMLISSIRKTSQMLSDTAGASPITSFDSNAQLVCHPWQHGAYLLIQIIENHRSFLEQNMLVSDEPARLGVADFDFIYQSSVEWSSSPLVSALTDQLRDILGGLAHKIELAKEETFRY